ncbi:MAG: tetratricopeptide repeat protein [Gemmatimonadetes bacterium]|nr:tetratricopeptide repeat protein [Gemmatimonadota bacterium]MBI2402499.1 tetratricopeptide repeat protein [Gemmatimonadota bacterium]
MNRRAVFLTVVALLLFAAITLFKFRTREDEPGTEVTRQATAQEARIREFWEVYRQATEYRVAGDSRRAAESYARALELDPQHEDARYYLGNMYLELGRYREAETAWEHLVLVNPGSARAHSRLGDLHFCLEPGAPVDLTRAEAEFRRALHLNQEETGPLLRLGEIALVRGNLTDASYFLDAVIASNPGSAPAHFLKGYLAWRGGDLGQASALFAKAVELARPREPAGGVPGEGDTKRGLAPLLAPQMKCGALKLEIAEVSAPAGSDVPAQMQGQYQRLVEMFEEFRRLRS